MTDYLAITDTQVDPDAPVTSGLGYALRDNPIAIAEGSPGAPIASSGWHPYDGVLVGDGASGLIYDHAVSGSVASITTPTFTDGYEYRALLIGMQASPGFELTVGLQRSSDSTFPASAAQIVSGAFGPSIYSFSLELPLCRLSNRFPIVDPVVGTPGTFIPQFDLGIETKVNATRFTPTGASNWTSGKVYLQKRRDYMT